MSYEFTLNFAHTISFQSAFKLALDSAETAYASTQEILKANTFYVPAIRNHCEVSSVDKYWLESAMKMQFVFWPSENLLALCGNWPQGVVKRLHRKVFFQDGTDQDYPFETWDGICGRFNWYVDTCKQANKKTVELLLKEHFSKTFKLDQADDSRLDYYRRWAAYVSIYDSLKLDDWLYGRDNPNFIRFSLSPLTSQEREFEAWMQLKSLIQEHNKERK